MLSPKDQARDTLERATNILIVPAHDQSGDTLGSAFALGKALEKRGKHTSMYLPSEVPTKLSFLPRPPSILGTLSKEREFTLSINTREVPIRDLRYEEQGERLRIYLKTSSHLSKEHVSVEGGAHHHDLIVTVSAPDFESLGEAFATHPSLFFEIPVLNIDHRASNERFGKINLVDLGASTTAEVVYELLEYWNESLIDELVATALLTGILDGTKSFQGVMVSPRTLTLAADLMTRGAQREIIVQYLYKTREIGYLRLWGRVMARLEFASDLGIAYASIPEDDFASAGADANTLPAILEDLHEHFASFSTIVLFWNENEQSSPVSCLVSSRNDRVVETIAKRQGVRRIRSTLLVPLEADSLAEAARAFFDMLSIAPTAPAP